MKERYPVVLPRTRYFLDLISCRGGCPVRTNAGAYVRSVAEGNYRKGYEIAHSPNPWTSVCGRICAHPCESQCRRGAIDEPISIRALKRSLTERHGVENTLEAVRHEEPPALDIAVRKSGRPARIAVVGAGPAGLACAHDLAFLGYSVTVFEAAALPGGMLSQGIPEYRLPRDILRAEVDRIVRMGVEIKTGWRMGKDFTIGDLLRNDYAAAFLAFGATRGRELSLPGVHLDGVINGVDFLLNANLGYHVELGARVVVVGGGNVAVDVARTALRYEAAQKKEELPPGAEALLESWGYDNTLIDAARTALRLGARRVTMMSLEGRNEMPAAMEEVGAAEEEGIQLFPGRGPKRILGENGKVIALETHDVKSILDDEGRFNPSFLPATERQIECDTVILAVGQAPDLSSLSGDSEVAITPHGWVQVDPKTLATSVQGIFCGGDLAFGPRIVIEAAADGKRAALSIHQWLGGKSLDRAPMRFRKIELSRWQERYDSIPRQPVPCIPVQRRAGFREIEQDYSESQSKAEGERCLWCNVSPIFDSQKCILCAGCVDICPENCLKLVRFDKLTGDSERLESLRSALGVSARGGAILKDEERCIRCGLCADRCPTGAVTMELLEIDDSPTGALQLFAEEAEE